MTDTKAQGADISAWQAPSIDEALFDTLDFVGIRGTYGTARDVNHDQHVVNAQKHGTAIIAYGFGRNMDGAAQAQALLAEVPEADAYCLDWEKDGNNASMTREQATAFITYLKANTAKPVGLYHSESGFPSGMGEEFRWVAKWGTVPPAGTWLIWQTRGSPLDLDVWNGTHAQMNAFLGRSAAPAPAPTPSPAPAPAPAPKPKPVAFSLHIPKGAKVRYATAFGPHFTLRTWSPPGPAWTHASSAPCRAPVTIKGEQSGSARVAYVTAGGYTGKWVLLANGVNAI